ncbi:MAG: hypothetical protein ACREO5_11365, partial [Candidatus Binatia bacterium]
MQPNGFLIFTKKRIVESGFEGEGGYIWRIPLLRRNPLIPVRPHFNIIHVLQGALFCHALVGTIITGIFEW